MTPVSLSFELKAAPPSEFRIFPAGDVATKKGTFVFDDKAAASVLAKQEDWGNEYSLDYEHAAVTGTATGEAPAAGWYKLEVRSGELWATGVRWTEKALSYLTDRAYRYFSPTFTTDKSGRILELINIALTNLPATKGMTPLVTSVTAELPGETPKMEPKIITLTGAKTEGEAEGVILAWKAASEQVKTLSARVSELETEKTDREVAELIAQAEKDGKVTPASRPFIEKLARADIETLRGFLSAAPVQSAARPEAKEPEKDGTTVHLTAEDTAIALMLGLDPKSLAATKAQHSNR